MKSILLVFILVLNISGVSYAQDFYFSQFYSSPLTLNPAMTGLMNGDFRTAINYRNQNTSLSPFTTISASFDTKILKNKLGRNVLSIGAVVIHDELYNKYVNNTTGMFSLAFHKSLSESGNDYLAAGFQGGVYQRYLNLNAFTYPEQWVPSTGEASGFVTQQFQNMNVTLFDMNAGLLWYHYFGRKSSLFLGGSIFHLAQPKAQYLNSDGFIARRYVVHGGSRISINDKISMIPNFIFMYQNKAKQVILGSSVEYRLNNSAFKTGGWYKYNDTFILYLGMEYKGVDIGASYDFISSSKYLGQNKGGVEVSLIFTSYYKKNVTLKSNPGNRF